MLLKTYHKYFAIYHEIKKSRKRNKSKHYNFNEVNI